MASPNIVSNENNSIARSPLGSIWHRFKALPGKLAANMAGIVSMAGQIARDDPRRVVHSMKMGLALTLVSLFYYFQPLYDSFGVSAMWAVMTVVVVFEFTVGATLGKGLNRAFATLVAGGLGVGAHHLASLCGKIGEPVLIGSFVFLLAAASTFMRFFPKIKARYDYGFLIFTLTFSFISISGLRAAEIIELAHKRLTTIVIGASTSLIINIFLCPVWAGEELHNSISLNMEKLASFLEGFGAAYFKISEAEVKSKDGTKQLLQGYKSVLNSKSLEENLANFARWEPGHGRFRFRHPWSQYLKLGALIRQCAYRIDALNAYFNPNIQVSQKFRGEIREVCMKMSMESSKTLRELGESLRTMTHPSSSSVNAHLASSKAAVKTLKYLLKSGSLCEDTNLLQVIPAVTVAYLLIDIVECTEKIAVSTYDLAILAKFKHRVKGSIIPQEKLSATYNKPESDANQVSECPEIVIAVPELMLTNSKSRKGEDPVEPDLDTQHISVTTE